MKNNTLMDDNGEEKEEEITEQKQIIIHNVPNSRSYYAKYYFPPPQTYTQYNQLEFTNIGITYMTTRIDAELISGIIFNYCRKKHLNHDEIVITDATAGLGGNTFSFARLFKLVNAVERDATQYKLLENNIRAYEIKNITLHNTDYLKIYDNLQQHVIFIDPPWGGKKYRTFKQLRLNLSGIEIEKLVEMLSRKSIVVLKLPLNYDMSVMQKLAINNIKICIHKLKKMFILVIYSKNLVLAKI
jgi:16S rRNA G966 N2-methylase RsmD